MQNNYHPDELYEIVHRRSGYSTILSVRGVRDGIEVYGSEKAVPPVLLYNSDGSYEVLGPSEILSAMEMHPYTPGSGDFNPERLADLEVSSFYSQLSHFPTLPSISLGDRSCVHPVAEYIYGNMLYLKPSGETSNFIASIPFLERGKIQAELIDKVTHRFWKDTGIRLDLFSIPKRLVGTFCYIADDDDGYSPVVKTFAFGFHRAIPCDRVARELGSLKACEMFVNPIQPPYPIPKSIERFVTMVKVGIVGTEHPMEDSADLYPSGVQKVAAVLSKRSLIRDIESVPEDSRNLRYISSRSGVEIVHVEESLIDETKESPGAIRLIFPGGVKVAAGVQETQGFCKSGNIDALLDFRTIAGKGAVSWFGMIDKHNFGKELSLDQCIEAFKNTPLQDITVGSKTYSGYVIEVPVMRPGQRYTELSKASNRVTVDIISKAILKKEVRVKERVEKSYQDLKEFRQAVLDEISLIQNNTNVENELPVSC